MPSKREVQARRREAIRNILLTNEPPIEEQKELLKRLKEMGIPATQSSVSRDLREMGVVRVAGHYEIPSWFDEESPFRRAKDLVVKIATAGPYQTVIVTQPGAGGFVAEAVEASQWEDVVATVAGYSSVLILTENKFFQDVVWHHLKHYLDMDSKAEEQESAKTES